jgi:hypothetical protein
MQYTMIAAPNSLSLNCWVDPFVLTSTLKIVDTVIPQVSASLSAVFPKHLQNFVLVEPKYARFGGHETNLISFQATTDLSQFSSHGRSLFSRVGLGLQSGRSP